MNVIARTRYSRNCTNDDFPLPTVMDCLFYAHSESGETASSLMYVRRPGDKRNNNRDRDPRREWGQCGYMLISAWIQLRREDTFVFAGLHAENTLDTAYASAAGAIVTALESAIYGDQNGLELYNAIEAWQHVCVVADWNADQLIDEVCAEFERKHCVTREVL